MRRTITAIPVLCLSLALTACGGNAPEQASDEQPGTPSVAVADAPPANRAPATFMLCQSCHAIEPGRNGIGPSLAGVFGHKAASAPGFSYSPALGAANLTWNRATLDQWLTSPMKMVPGTRMVYAGMADPVRRKEMIDYLETLR